MGTDADGVPWIIGASLIWTTYLDGDVLGTAYRRRRRV